MLRCPLVLTALLLVPSAPAARTWHITPDGAGDAPTIQAGMDSASAGDTVLLASGTYREHDIVVTPGIIFRSASRDPATTVLDAEQNGRVLSGYYLDDTLIEGITITNGLATWGAGLDAEVGSPVVRRCVFYRNIAYFRPDYAGWGGGMLCYEGDPVVEDCVFIENEADVGGGFYIGESATPVIERCLFVANEAYWGGAIHCGRYASPTISHCTLHGNILRAPDAYFDGAGVSCAYAASPLLENTIIAFSPSGRAVGTTCPWNPSSPILRRCDLYGNAGGDWTGCFVVESQAGVNGNFSADPLFCSAEGGFYTLRSGSPCAPSGSTTNDLVGAFPVGCGPLSNEPMTWARIKKAYR